MNNEMDRRDFLKHLTAFNAGVISAACLPFVDLAAVRAIKEVTGKQSGNASVETGINEACKNTPNPEDCKDYFEYTPVQQFTGIIQAPIMEEITFRGFPSLVLDNKEWEENPEFTGKSEGLGMTRRELIYGAVSTTMFALLHNITQKGFDTNIIPTQPVTHGAAYWYLQRKFGLLSNTISHMLNNYLAMK